MSEHEPELDKTTKEKINKEGWEENAAVLVGKEHEMEGLLKKLEAGDHIADLGTYIRIHKEVVLSPDEPEITSEITKAMSARRGECIILDFEGTVTTASATDQMQKKSSVYSLYYINRGGNVARDIIYSTKIAPYTDSAV